MDTFWPPVVELECRKGPARRGAAPEKGPTEMLNTVKAWTPVTGEVPKQGGDILANLYTFLLPNDAEGTPLADLHVHMNSPQAFQFAHAAAGSPGMFHNNGSFYFKLPATAFFTISIHGAPGEEAPAA